MTCMRCHLKHDPIVLYNKIIFLLFLQLLQKSEDSGTTTLVGQPTVAEQLMKQQQVTSTAGGVNKTADSLAATSSPPTAPKTTPTSTQQKYAVTPQVVQEGLSFNQDFLYQILLFEMTHSELIFARVKKDYTVTIISQKFSLLTL